MSTEFIDVRMPDGTVVRGVPKGTPKSEVQRRYDAMKGGTPAPAEDLTAINGAQGETLVTSTPSEIARGLATGAGKGAAKFVLSGVQWLQNILGANVSPTPMAIIPKTQIEAIGGMIPQMAIPIAAGVATGGMSIPVQVAAGGLSSAMAASAGGASPASTQVSGFLGGAGPAITASPMASLLRKQARERVASAISPSGIKEKTALDAVIDEITARKPLAASSEGLLKTFEKAADKANAEFNNILARGPQLINVRAVSDKIDDVINSMKVAGRFATPEDASAAEQLRQVQREIRALARGPIPNAATMNDVRALKQRYDKIIQGPGKDFNRTLPEASRAEAADTGFWKIREGMIEQNPALAQAGKEAQRAITPRNILAKQEIRNISGGMDKVGNIVELGMIAGAAASGRIEPAIAAVTLSVLRHVLASTPRKLISAAARTTLANAIEKGNVEVAMKIAGQTPAIMERLTQLGDEFKR